MKLLLDECLPIDLRHLIAGHDVFTVQYQGWKGLKNGELLAAAAGQGFDALVTTDEGIPFQQNLATLPLSIVVLESPSNDLPDLSPLIPNLLRALPSLAPRSVINVKR